MMVRAGAQLWGCAGKAGRGWEVGKAWGVRRGDAAGRALPAAERSGTQLLNPPPCPAPPHSPPPHVDQQALLDGGLALGVVGVLLSLRGERVGACNTSLSMHAMETDGETSAPQKGTKCAASAARRGPQNDLNTNKTSRLGHPTVGFICLMGLAFSSSLIAAWAWPMKAYAASKPASAAWAAGGGGGGGKGVGWVLGLSPPPLAQRYE